MLERLYHKLLDCIGQFGQFDHLAAFVSRIGRFFRPVDPLKPRKKESKEPRIIYSCDVCTYKYVSYPKDWSDETLQKERDSLKRIALRQRQVLCSQEIREILREHPEYKPEQIDEVYRKVAEKWHV